MAICHWGTNLHSKGQLAGLRLALPGRLFFLYLPVCVSQSPYLWVRQRVRLVLTVCAINFKNIPRGTVGISVRINNVLITCILCPYRLFFVLLRYNIVTVVKP